MVHPILPCRIRTAMSRVVARQGEGVGARHRTHPPLPRHRLASPDRFQVVALAAELVEGEAQPSESTVTEMMP